MNIVKEIWKPIKGYYSISNLGNVRNDKTQHILQGDYNTVGYRRVILYADWKHKRGKIGIRRIFIEK